VGFKGEDILDEGFDGFVGFGKECGSEFMELLDLCCSFCGLLIEVVFNIFLLLSEYSRNFFILDIDQLHTFLYLIIYINFLNSSDYTLLSYFILSSWLARLRVFVVRVESLFSGGDKRICFIIIV
jgi:hypothetical protein